MARRRETAPRVDAARGIVRETGSFMSTLVDSRYVWLRRPFGLSWLRLLGGLGLATGALALAIQRGQLPAWLVVILAGLLLVAAGLLLRRARPELLGPVVWYELVRSARQGRSFTLRCAYAGVLLAMLFLVYIRWFGGARAGWWRFLLDSGSIPIPMLTAFASGFSSAFMGVQMLVVFVLTPAYVAGAIADERERKTLDFLLVTHLRNREIVLGKLVSRLAGLVLVVLTGLPILGLMQFLGGIEPNLVLAGFAATLATLVSLGSLSVLNSVYTANARQAAFHTYLQMAGYLLLTLGGVACVGKMSWVGAGNPIVAAIRLESSSDLTADLPWLLGEYLVFHVLTAALWLTWAVRRLRARPERSSPRPVLAVSARKPMLQLADDGWLPAEQARLPHHVIPRPQYYDRPLPPRKPRPRVHGEPLLWKELYVEPGLGLHGGARILATFIVLMGLLSGWIFLAGVLTLVLQGDLSRYSNIWCRIVGTTVGCALLMVVAFRASSSLTRERDRQTLDSLLTLPVENRTLLLAKWLGSILGPRGSWWCLVVIWALGAVTGGICPFALVLLVIGCAVYAMFMACLGLWFSLVCQTTLRATTWTVITLVAVHAAPFAMGTLAYGVFGERASWQTYQLFGASPPATLWSLCFYSGDFKTPGLAMQAREQLWAALFGLGLCATAAALLWRFINKRFARVTGRMPITN
jgi:ABC-type transport system involved in multi-copper enzyme maturation permease subunit